MPPPTSYCLLFTVSVMWRFTKESVKKFVRYHRIWCHSYIEFVFFTVCKFYTIWNKNPVFSLLYANIITFILYISKFNSFKANYISFKLSKCGSKWHIATQSELLAQSVICWIRDLRCAECHRFGPAKCPLFCISTVN